jgi:hypothetical protein
VLSGIGYCVLESAVIFIGNQNTGIISEKKNISKFINT